MSRKPHEKPAERILRGHGWTADLPEGWVSRRPRTDPLGPRSGGPDFSRGVIFAHRKVSVGELSFAEIESPREISAMDMAGTARGLCRQQFGPNVPIQPVSFGPFTGWASEGDIRGTHWRFWWLLAERVQLFAGYRCPAEHRAVEKGEVDAILRSLRLQADPPPDAGGMAGR